MSTLLFQDKLSLRTTYTSEPRHRKVEFGDGYIQRSPWGPYAGRRTLNVVHENLSQTDADTLIAYYENNFDNPVAIEIAVNELTLTSGKYYLESYDVELVNDKLRTISAAMTEVFGE